MRVDRRALLNKLLRVGSRHRALLNKLLRVGLFFCRLLSFKDFFLRVDRVGRSALLNKLLRVGSRNRLFFCRLLSFKDFVLRVDLAGRSALLNKLLRVGSRHRLFFCRLLSFKDFVLRVDHRVGRSALLNKLLRVGRQLFSLKDFHQITFVRDTEFTFPFKVWVSGINTKQHVIFTAAFGRRELFVANITVFTKFRIAGFVGENWLRIVANSHHLFFLTAAGARRNRLWCLSFTLFINENVLFLTVDSVHQHRFRSVGDFLSLSFTWLVIIGNFRNRVDCNIVDLFLPAGFKFKLAIDRRGNR